MPLKLCNSSISIIKFEGQTNFFLHRLPLFGKFVVCTQTKLQRWKRIKKYIRVVFVFFFWSWCTRFMALWNQSNRLAMKLYSSVSVDAVILLWPRPVRYLLVKRVRYFVCRCTSFIWCLNISLVRNSNKKIMATQRFYFFTEESFTDTQ